MTLPQNTNSPLWSTGSKRLILITLALIFVLFILRVKILLPPFIFAVILAYLVEPLVNLVTKRIPIPRILTLVLIYLVIIAALIAIPASAIPPIVTQVNALITYIPAFIHQLSQLLAELQEPILITEDIIIPINQLPLDQAFLSLSGNLLNLVQGFGGQTISIFGSVLGASLSTVGWVVLVLFLSFYMVKDHESLFQAMLVLAPPNYRSDVINLSQQISDLWNAFLRGQLVLCMVVGSIVFFMALILGLPNALLLALIAGLMEFLPTIGPVLAAVPAVFLGYFQSNGSWLGQLIGPFWFVIVIIILYTIIYQMENYYLVPRIIGHRLQLHPIVVVLGAIAGASIAGIFGIMLAAPLLASGRIFFAYIYAKLTDQPPFPNALVSAQSDEQAALPDSNPQNSEV
ncbi:MAG: AI-2E family transporter [Candidatus Promineifilaceae bacterium]